MAIIRPLRGFTPKIGKNCFIAENAVIIGDVTIGDDCSIWYGVVLRGDVNTIKIGNRVNIQDNASVHTLYQRSVTIIGDDVSVGLQALANNAGWYGQTQCGNMYWIATAKYRVGMRYVPYVPC